MYFMKLDKFLEYPFFEPDNIAFIYFVAFFPNYPKLDSSAQVNYLI